ncbi:hypothetical protein ACO0QE_002752 [Hanseniaspora vineae]
MAGAIKPRDLPSFHAVGFQDRVKFVKQLYESVSKFYKNSPLTQQKLVRKCQFLEYKIAKVSKTSQNYKFKLGLLLREIQKHKGNFKKFESNIFPGDENSKDKLPKLNSNDPKVYERLLDLVASEKVLLESGYITSVPVKSELLMDVKTTSLSKFADCARCSLKFDKTEIMKDAVCKYHKDKGTFQSGVRVYSCCGVQEGCSQSNHHVFKGATPLDLLEISDFASTQEVDGEFNVLALDCEMGYTSLGFEMIRLTIVEFFSEKIVYDKIVQPIGEIIDLNTDFSGVSKIDCIFDPTFINAREEYITPKLINKNSLLIGHGLENDLNVMRLVHDKVIDTAILFAKDLKYKPSLKNLSFLELSKRIQVGEHDSSEDAIAALQIVKKKIAI